VFGEGLSTLIMILEVNRQTGHSGDREIAAADYTAKLRVFEGSSSLTCKSLMHQRPTKKR
jgi:hypothetical protein